MSLEAWGDEGDVGIDGYVTDETAEEMFVKGAQMMRALIAEIWRKSGERVCSETTKKMWRKNWGKDPGEPDEIIEDVWA